MVATVGVRRVLFVLLLGGALVALPGPLRGDEAARLSDEARSAVEKSLTLLQKTTHEYRNHRECFSCHHQALPTLAFAEARRRGFAVDEENFQATIALTAKHLENGRERYLDGRGQGGKADTAGYALWTLSVGGWRADATTTAVAEYLLALPGDTSHWRRSSNRPPSEASDYTTTFVALRGLKFYGTEEQKDRIADRIAGAKSWLTTAPGGDTEDHVFRLQALHLLGCEDMLIRAATEELLQQQRADGGWSQIETLESDAYATGAVLAALREAGGLSPTDVAYQRGARYLLGEQRKDGSWRVVSRSDPFQTYFESGFPHGRDQFISAAATSWATIALLHLLPEK